jgi:hypothetical protein
LNLSLRHRIAAEIDNRAGDRASGLREDFQSEKKQATHGTDRHSASTAAF